MVATSFIKDAKNSWDIWKSSQWKKVTNNWRNT